MATTFKGIESESSSIPTTVFKGIESETSAVPKSIFKGIQVEYFVTDSTFKGIQAEIEPLSGFGQIIKKYKR